MNGVNTNVVLLQQRVDELAKVNIEQGDKQQTAAFMDRLATRLNRAWEQARNEKDNGMTERLLQCQRQRQGVYDPDKLMQIKQQGGSEVYMLLTSVKCNAAASWINDVLDSAGEDVFDVTPTNEPEMPHEVKSMIVDQVRMEAQAFVMQTGAPVTPEMVRDRMEDIRDNVLKELREEAEEAAGRMAGKMRDQLVRGGWRDALRDFIDDFVTYPTAIFVGPIIKRKPRIAWGPDYKPVIVNDLAQSFERIPPYDAFPSKGSSGPQSGYIVIRRRLYAGDLYDMIGTPGYSDDAIRSVIQNYPQGYSRWLMSDTERAALEGQSSSWTDTSEMDVLEYYGPALGSELEEWGYRGDKKLDPERSYEVNAWWVGPHVIKAVINPHPLGKRPIHTASWKPIPGAFWGRALPEEMRDIQQICNASARSLNNNLGIASGPQVEVHVDRLPPGEQVTEMYPWKMWQTTTDRTGGGQPAIRFFQPPSNAAELMNVYLTFAKQADEVTGIPNYVYGSTSVGGAGRTASGLSMLMDNAAKGIKSAIAHIDNGVVVPVTQALYLHNMIYDPDVYAKGDFNIVPRGASGLLQREAIAVRRREFLSATANPIDLQIMGPQGRAYLLKDVAKALQMDEDRLVPNVPKELQMGGQQPGLQTQPQTAMIPGTEGSVPEQGQTLDPAGNPVADQPQPQM